MHFLVSPKQWYPLYYIYTWSIIWWGITPVFPVFMFAYVSTTICVIACWHFWTTDKVGAIFGISGTKPASVVTWCGISGFSALFAYPSLSFFFWISNAYASKWNIILRVFVHIGLIWWSTLPSFRSFLRYPYMVFCWYTLNLLTDNILQ